ncbi:oxygen-insensitive NAD(P)H nitroreductase [Entomohabitans teleogrylli]|uniref:oxygen-insensitive NAD(P)H nitroreductase n=1 Tax=Entomohabitans teleogrylli TaxID=1384589 RepID=UPI00073D269C|nr:oxygen-insensitive NAD(P)H nitroreductase [Entomohabitans teleogrylli]
MNLEEIIRNRYTCKAYDESRKVTPDQKRQLMELLRLSPSSVNSQPWHFFVIDTPEGKAQILPAFSEANAAKIDKSALTVVFTTRTEIDEAHLNHLLAQEQQDGRFINDDAKSAQDTGRRYFVNLNSDSVEKQRNWMARQAYISLGFLLLGAAALGMDATPIEGFTPPAMDKALGLEEKGLTSVVVATVGFRGEGDFNTGLPKSRLPQSEVITLL